MGTIKFKNLKINNYKNSVEIVLDSKTISYENAFLFDSFNDCHGHLLALGKKLVELDLSGCKNLGECINKIKHFHSRRGKWIVGRGWNNEIWDDNKLPNKFILDEYFPDTPIFLTRVDGHCAWINSEAIKESGLNPNLFLKQNDSKIELESNGEPNGIIYDYAIDYVKKFIPDYNENEKKDFIIKGSYELLKNGITTIHDMDVHPSLISIFKELDRLNDLPIKIFSFVSGNKNEWLDYNVTPYAGKNFNIVGVKFYADGSLGSRTAALLNDFEDDIGNKGIFLNDEKKLYEQCKIALTKGFQVATHAIGDAANRMVLKVYAKLFDNGIADEKSILRVEHAQHIHPDDFKYFEKYPIIASIQPIHCVSDALTIAEKRLGNRCDYAYPWKSLLQHNARIISGSDFPIESCNPFQGIKAFIHRVPFGKNKSWYPKECLNLEEALNSYISLPNKLYNKQEDLSNRNNGIIIIDKPIELVNEIETIKVKAVIFNNTFYKIEN